jgi:hypothetical protein
MMLKLSVSFEKLLRAPTVTDELPLKSRTWLETLEFDSGDFVQQSCRAELYCDSWGMANSRDFRETSLT